MAAVKREGVDPYIHVKFDFLPTKVTYMVVMATILGKMVVLKREVVEIHIHNKLDYLESI